MSHTPNLLSTNISLCLNCVLIEQFLPETTGLLPITGPQDAHRILETVPRPFCRTQAGQQTDFLFKELSFDNEKYSRKKRETGQYHQIKFGDPIPEELNTDATKAWESTARTGFSIHSSLLYIHYHQILLAAAVPCHNSLITTASCRSNPSGTKLKIAEVKLALSQKFKEKPSTFGRLFMKRMTLTL